MDLFELELERRLARREPPRGFSNKVMARVREEIREEPGEASRARTARPRRIGVRWLSDALSWGRGGRKAWTWGVTGALAATLAVGAFVENRKVEQRRRAVEQAQAEQAEAELVDALFVTGAKIHLARERAGAWKGD